MHIWDLNVVGVFLFCFVGFDLNKRWTGLENIMGQTIQPMMEQWYDFEACHLVAAKKRLFSFSKVPLVELKYSGFFCIFYTMFCIF